MRRISRQRHDDKQVSRSSKIALVAGLIVAAVGAGLLGRFLAHQGLERAALWATVLGFVLGGVGTAATVWMLVLSLKSSSASSQSTKEQAVASRRRADQRARFAGRMAGEVDRVSDLEDWQDERFAELEAEVEMYGRSRRGILRRRRRETIRRVPSLSVALEKSDDRVTLLEGEPGSGKSVALRHVAIRMATNVKNHPSERGVIPIYLNLKEFRPADEVDASSVRDFIISSINRLNNQRVEIFLDQEFDRGLEEGTWLFLFDSFDEIPAVLGTVEADEVIESYAAALYDFVTGMSDCRGIIGTREFRGPKRISWPRFRILRLTDEQRHDLIEKLGLPREVELQLFSGLETADPSIRQLRDNPLFLALLCSYLGSEMQFPTSSHVVFENYVGRRFHDDTVRLANRFALTAESVRLVAEQAAYCMAAQPGLGLSPTRDALLEGMRRAGFVVEIETSTALDALEYLRLARAEGGAGNHPDSFTFAHRRFQEYFATCLVMGDNTRVDPVSLLTNGRWRETAATLFQTQDETSIQPLLIHAQRLLVDMMATIGISDAPQDSEDHVPVQVEPSDLAEQASTEPFNWPTGSLHLLGLLQDGLPSGDRRRAPAVEALAGRLLTSAINRGQLHDRRWGVELCLAAGPETAHDIMRAAFKSSSAWLREAAYAQAGRLDEVPTDLRPQIRSALAELAAGGRLRQQRLAVEAQLRRLPNSQPEQLLARTFLFTPLIDAILCATLAIACIAASGWYWRAVVFAIGFALLGHSTLYLDRGVRHIDAESRYSGGLSWIYAFWEILFGDLNPVSLAYTALFIRAAMILFITGGLLVNLGKSSPLALTAIWLAFFVVLTWAPASVRADRILRDPTLTKIIALPLASLLYMSRLTLVNIQAIRKWLKNLTKRSVAITVACACLVVMLLFIRPVSQFVAGPFLIFFTVTIVAFIVLLGWLVIVNNVEKSWRDRRLLKKIDNNDFTYDDFADMLDVLARFRTRRAMLLFIQEVKRRGTSREHPGALRALRSFAALSQEATSNPEVPASICAQMEPDELAKLNHWIQDREPKKRWIQKLERTRRLSIVGQAATDEIAKLVAEVELVRHSALGPPLE